MTMVSTFLKHRYSKNEAPIYLDYDIIGMLVFLGLAIAAYQLNLERILLPDPAFYLFQMINNEQFFIVGDRYTMVINQIIPLLGVKINLPLSQLVKLYSLNFVAVAFAFYLLANYAFKNQTAGISILLIFTTGIAFSYFRPTSESILAMLNSMVFYSFLEWMSIKKDSLKKYLAILIFALVFIFFGYFSHPMALFSLIFVVGFHTIDQKLWNKWYPYVIVLLILLIFGQRIFLADSQSHEGSIYGNLIKDPIQAIREIPNYYSFKFFKGYFSLLFYPLTCMTLIGLVFSGISKRWTMLLFGLLFLIGYFIVACTTYQAGDSNMQMEKIFLPLTLCAAFYFSTFFLRKYHIKWISPFLLAGIIIFGSFKISEVKSLFTKRIAYTHTILDYADDQEHAKLVLEEDQMNTWLMRFMWGSGVESLILSSIRNKDQARTFHITSDLVAIQNLMQDSTNFIPTTFWTGWKYEYLNPKYFILPKEPYHKWDRMFK